MIPYLARTCRRKFENVLKSQTRESMTLIFFYVFLKLPIELVRGPRLIITNSVQKSIMETDVTNTRALSKFGSVRW